MRAVFLIILMLGGVFLGGVLTMWISDAIVSPFGLHGYNYSDALKISFLTTLSAIAGTVISILTKVVLDD